MSRGREAARAAHRRAEEARQEAQNLREELTLERQQRKAEADELRAEIKQLNAGHMATASRLAADEVTRKMAELEEERRQKGFSDEVVRNMLYLKDKFVLNACRYISMTTGERPLAALSMVMTWMTDEDFYGFENVEVIGKLGLPTDGWVARFIRQNKHDLRRIARVRAKDGRPAAVTLDHALAEGNSRIHPDYNPRWYPNPQYPRIEIVEDVA